MSDLLALSADIPISPRLTFDGHQQDNYSQYNGWGVAWYPDQELRATAIRDPASRGSAGLTEILADWELIKTPLLLSHARADTNRAIYRDTHPFIFNFKGSSWTIAHSGELVCDIKAQFPIDDDFAITPLGDSDTEHLLCWILNEVDKAGASSIEEFGYGKLGDLLCYANQFGTLTTQISDGRALFSYACNSGGPTLYSVRTSPKDTNPETLVADEWTPDRLIQRFQRNGLGLDVLSYSSSEYCLVVSSTVALNDDFQPVIGGHYLVAERGALVFEADAEEKMAPKAQGVLTVAKRITQGPPKRILRVSHTTKYSYQNPVEKSSHRLRLSPIVDRFQTVLSHSLNLSVDGFRYQFEDVFGNQVLGLDIDATYQELVIAMNADVEVTSPIDRPDLLSDQQALPIFWMPWQAKMMQSYLLPPELPESQLRELTEYARSFSVRNNGDLLSTLEDITYTIYSDFVYKPGHTNNETTPYEVFKSHKGVCQDFANLMICLARMLNIPARYRVGYIYTGSNYENTQQSDASHAWVEAYIPNFGWRGFDPTNGSRTSGDHIRVASGRNYIDATPTSGVVFGGSTETMQIDVQVTDLEVSSNE